MNRSIHQSVNHHICQFSRCCTVQVTRIRFRCFRTFMFMFVYGKSKPKPFNPLADDKFYSSKLKEFADDNFKFYENGCKLSKRVENIVGKGEITGYEPFLHFLTVVSKGLFPRGIKRCHCVGMG